MQETECRPVVKPGYVVAIALAAFAAGALIVGAAAQPSGPMGTWSTSDMWAACQGMMQAARPTP